MSFQTYIPQQPLASYVHMLWYWEGYHPPHPRERILPGGMMEITINLTETPFCIDDANQGAGPKRIAGPMAAGARSKHFIIETTQPMSILSVWFKPGGALSFFAVPGDELHNLHLPLEVLWGPKARILYDQLLQARDTHERFLILERALLDQLCRANARHRAVAYALQALSTVPHSQTLNKLVQSLALSPTRFIQVFREDVGMTPKQFCRVQRFQQALHFITAQPEPDWTDIALRCGYYDQSHFINDFRSFSGITPSVYAPQSREHNSNLPVYEPG